MLHQIQELDTQLFLWLNAFHAPWADTLMAWVTSRDAWIPFYVLLLGWLVWQYKRQSISMILAMIITILIADQFTSSFLKPFVQRLRPCYVAYLEGKVHTVVGCGGTYGFASSHAANSFGLAMILCLLLPNFKYKNVFFVWAALVSYSRIYVGVHYPLDIVCGALIGIGAAFISLKLVQHKWHMSKS
jgi:undecaprenyl-diphosphatase